MGWWSNAYSPHESRPHFTSDPWIFRLKNEVTIIFLLGVTNKRGLPNCAAFCFLVVLKVPKREIFDRSDFPDFYTIKSLRVGDFGVKIKSFLTNI